MSGPLQPDQPRSGRTGVLCVGVAVQDFIFFVDEMPVRPEKYRARDMMVVGGGCAATASAAVARLGGIPLLATRLGQDGVGDQIVAELEGYGVDCTLARRYPGHRSSMSSIFVDCAGERLIMNFRDHELPAGFGWLPDLSSLGVGAVLADTRWPGGAEAAMQAARNAGLPGIVDAEKPVREAERAVRLASHIAFSRNGLIDWTGHDNLPAGIGEVAAETGAFVCVTDGANGTWFVDAVERDHIPAFAVDAVDTLGAGDVWHGAFALRLAEGADARSAIRFASAAAAIKCSRYGGRAGIPERSDVEELMMEQAA
jgi:sulfofructose kinase